MYSTPDILSRNGTHSKLLHSSRAIKIHPTIGFQSAMFGCKARRRGIRNEEVRSNSKAGQCQMDYECRIPAGNNIFGLGYSQINKIDIPLPLPCRDTTHMSLV
jgi:hypothetical protein